MHFKIRVLSQAELRARSASKGIYQTVMADLPHWTHSWETSGFSWPDPAGHCRVDYFWSIAIPLSWPTPSWTPAQKWTRRNFLPGFLVAWSISTCLFVTPCSLSSRCFGSAWLSEIWWDTTPPSSSGECCPSPDRLTTNRPTLVHQSDWTGP